MIATIRSHKSQLHICTHDRNQPLAQVYHINAHMHINAHVHKCFTSCTADCPALLLEHVELGFGNVYFTSNIKCCPNRHFEDFPRTCTCAHGGRSVGLAHVRAGGVARPGLQKRRLQDFSRWTILKLCIPARLPVLSVGIRALVAERWWVGRSFVGI